MRYLRLFIVVFLAAGAFSIGHSQSQSAGKVSPEEIIKKFAERETEFYDAWMQYTYTQTASIQVRSVNGTPRRERMTIVSEVVFNDDGTREVRTLRSNGRLQAVQFTEEDREVINNINPFALTANELPLYKLEYEGKEMIDELNCYVFSVKPKSTRGNRKYFEGKIWVDEQDLQVVRTMGKAVPQSRENQFPEFETLRQIVDNKYWFPVWTHADSVLRFPGQDVRIEETITYDNYKKFGSKATIKFDTDSESEKGGEEKDEK